MPALEIFLLIFICISAVLLVCLGNPKRIQKRLKLEKVKLETSLENYSEQGNLMKTQV